MMFRLWSTSNLHSCQPFVVRARYQPVYAPTDHFRDMWVLVPGRIHRSQFEDSF
jgi:hypothetical protein